MLLDDKPTFVDPSRERIGATPSAFPPGGALIEEQGRSHGAPPRPTAARHPSGSETAMIAQRQLVSTSLGNARSPDTRSVLLEQARTARENRSAGSEGGPVAFLSYSRKDYVVAWSLAVVLDALGYRLVIDRVSLHSGENWRNKLKAAIDTCDVFVLIWGRNAKRSPHMEWEVDCARSRLYSGPPMVFLPVPIDSLSRAPIPPGLDHLHFPEPPYAWH
jgi:TIR domain